MAQRGAWPTLHPSSGTDSVYPALLPRLTFFFSFMESFIQRASVQLLLPCVGHCCVLLGAISSHQELGGGDVCLTKSICDEFYLSI